MSAQLDFEDVAELAGGDDVTDVGEGGLEAAVVPDEELSGEALAGFLESEGVPEGDGDGLFADDVVSGLEGADGVVDVVGRAGGDGEHIDVGGVDDGLDAVEESDAGACLGGGLAAFGVPVASGDDLVFVGVLADFAEVHLVSGPAKADDADAQLVRHGAVSPDLDGDGNGWGRGRPSARRPRTLKCNAWKGILHCRGEFVGVKPPGSCFLRRSLV